MSYEENKINYDFSPRAKRPRLFEPGNLKILVLHLLSQQASYGYELMKEIEKLVGGEYVPSAGVIYPILAALEELGYASIVAMNEGRKRYNLTTAGATFLTANTELLERILLKLQTVHRLRRAHRAPEIQRAIHNFKMALHLRLDAERIDAEAIQNIARIIDRAALEIERC